MSRRRLSDDERALWRGFARGVTPLRHSAGAPLDVAPDQAVREMPPPAQSVPKERAHAKQPPALAQFDRRLRQRVARGRAAIDARLDLHGMTQKQAHGALLRFLAQAQAQDAKLALVVTGKGIGGAADWRPNAACCGGKCHYGCHCRSSAALSSASNKRTPATAAKARFTCACGAARVSDGRHPIHTHR